MPTAGNRAWDTLHLPLLFGGILFPSVGMEPRPWSIMEIAPLYQQFWSQFLHHSRRLILPDSSFIAAWEMLCQGFL